VVAHAVKLRSLLQLFGMQCSRWSKISRSYLSHNGQSGRAVGGSAALVLMLFEASAVVGLVLAASGIHGVLSSSVTERTREIGVQAALGASHGNIVTLVARQGMMLTCFGFLVGLSGAVVARNHRDAVWRIAARSGHLFRRDHITALPGGDCILRARTSRRVGQSD
jgi:ABC-type lipoprotein release transport system permease subunit